jgi:STE24 endopeptidase
MMPLSLLIALVLAFGMDPSQTGVPVSDVRTRVLETFGGITLVATLAFGLGFWVALRVSQFGYAPSRLRRRYALGVRLLTIISLLVFAWIIHAVGWSKLVRTNWGLGGLVLIDDVVVFLPYLLIQLLVWWGLFFAERALQINHSSSPASGLGRYLILKTRQSVGLILPVILLYVIRRDVIERFWPEWDQNPLAEPLEIAVLGTMVLMISPLFVRFAWPTHSLPPGPLRRRLERIADRVGFQFSDVLVWDTGHMMVNACVTGILPRFRYVLLTDSLIESLSPLETAAVFGHEIGHIAHRHLLYFAFFFMGSLGILSLLAQVVSKADPLIGQLAWLTPWQPSLVTELSEGIGLLIVLGLYFWIVFGQVSRRFERQADVFGSKVVSCTLSDCPPHADLDNDLSPDPVRGAAPTLCPVGIRIFADALANVARFNGLDQKGRSWRHGSIAHRIAFLEGLERHPELELRFQRGVRYLRLGLMVVLGLTVLFALVTQSWKMLR